ncbi:hypothetical protein [Burkholderia multivorans]
MPFLDRPLDPADIVKRELQLVVPSETTPAQWEQISRAIQYGEN